jgi:DNA-binding SARP family transcriptional activator
MSTQGRLHISILGPPHFTVDDQPLVISRVQNRALLYRLATQSEPVTRDHLAFLFWPDVADAKARRNLTQLISHVRHSIPDPDLLLTTKEHVQLDLSRVHSDAIEFERLCALNDVASLRQAVNIYRDALLCSAVSPCPTTQNTNRGSVANAIALKYAF